MASFATFLSTLGNTGKDLEQFVLWFLAHDPSGSTVVEKVWLWDDWPGSGGRDCGIDLVLTGDYDKTWSVLTCTPLTVTTFGSSLCVWSKQREGSIHEASERRRSRLFGNFER